VWRLGRGAAKTTISAALALYFMWTSAPTWGVGQIPAAVVVSPARDTSLVAVTIGRELVRASPLEQFVIAKTDAKDSFYVATP